MGPRAKKPFNTLVIRANMESSKSIVFSINDDIGRFVDSYEDSIEWSVFSVYGILEANEDEETMFEDDFSSATQIGTIFGCHIPRSLIINLGDDPYDVCDSINADLEAMCSVIKEFEDDLFGLEDDIYYIHEIELLPEYQGKGYEKIILLQLPAIIVKMLRIFPSLLMYYPSPTHEDEQERDLEAEAILTHRLSYNLEKMFNILNDEESDNILLFPPKPHFPEIDQAKTLAPQGFHRNERFQMYG